MMAFDGLFGAHWTTTRAAVLTQSLNAFATRAPASIVRVDEETALLKIAAYQAIWATAVVV
jgi:hypothetical protein